MEQQWNIVYYETIDGKCEVNDFIESLKIREKAKILGWIEQLEKEGPNLRRPYADLLKDGIHELRIRISKNRIRILYFFCYQNTIVLTHLFKKDKAKVPPKEIEKAKDIRRDYLKRFPKDKTGEN